MSYPETLNDKIQTLLFSCVLAGIIFEGLCLLTTFIIRVSQ